MISASMNAALNEQFNRELYASNVYLALSAFFSAQNLEGFAAFFRAQSEDERGHALQQLDFLEQVEATPEFKAIPAPAFEGTTPLDALRFTLNQEEAFGKHFHAIVKQAIAEEDYATQGFYMPFINTQLQEVAEFKSIIRKLEDVGDSKSGLLYIDKEMKKKAMTP